MNQTSNPFAVNAADALNGSESPSDDIVTISTLRTIRIEEKTVYEVRESSHGSRAGTGMAAGWGGAGILHATCETKEAAQRLMRLLAEK